MDANLYARFRSHWRNRLDKTAIATPDGGRWTYGDIDRLSAQFAAALNAAGVAAGDRVVAQVEKSVGAVGLYLGTLRAGGVFVPLNTAYTPSEVEFFLADANPRVFFCRPEARGALRSIASRAGVDHIAALDTGAHEELWRENGPLEQADGIVARGGEDLASILYTSGTTGRSKGAMLSHRALSTNAAALTEIWELTADDVLLHALPIFHIHGLFVGLNTSFLNASKLLFLPSFDPRVVRRVLSKATVMMGVPTFYSRLLDHGITREECAHMRLFISGSAPLTEELSNAWEARTGYRILERYGMTEAGMIASNPLRGARIPGSVGFALPDVAIRVADGAGRELARGETGVIEVKGPNLFSGYWRLPKKTEQDTRADGFFITGDMGVMDADGRLRIVGRAKDLIISGGYNIYPKEIEVVLDAIAGVKESAVIGAPHKDLGEGVVAVLVAEKEAVADEVLQAALDEKLARFKHPRRFFWVTDLPRNAMGKVQKDALREEYKGAYNVTVEIPPPSPSATPPPQAGEE